MKYLRIEPAFDFFFIMIKLFLKHIYLLSVSFKYDVRLATLTLRLPKSFDYWLLIDSLGRINFGTEH